MSPQLQAVTEWLMKKNQPAYRAKQIQQAWYTQSNWEAVTTLPETLRTELAEQFPWLSFAKTKVFTSPRDDTKKALITLTDGKKIESVFMPNTRGKRTVCISSQIGCAMGCTFCATGKMGLARNLTVDEIIDQVRFWRFSETEPISNIVLMGMGEPLANYPAVKEAAIIFVENMGFGSTRITLSTVGIPAGLKRLLLDKTFPAVRVALSLHAGTDATRSSIIPTHRQQSIEDFANWIEQYLVKHGNRRHHITLEYVMLQDVNDSAAEAQALVKQFGKFGHKIKLNLIPWNPIGKALQSSTQEHLARFQAITGDGGIPTTIRYSKGLDIDAACGQLVVKNI